MTPKDYTKLLELLKAYNQMTRIQKRDFEQLWPVLFPRVQSADLYKFAFEWFRAGYDLAESRKER